MYELEISKLSKYLQTILDVEFEIFISKEEKMKNRTAYSEEGRIYLSDYWLSNLTKDDELMVVVVVAHEAFHIYQLEAIRYGWLEFSVLKKWKEEFDNYIEFNEDKEQYMMQSIEQTATIFASHVLEYFTKGNYNLNVKEILDEENIEIVDSLNIEYNYGKAILRNKPKCFSDFFS